MWRQTSLGFSIRLICQRCLKTRGAQLKVSGIDKKREAHWHLNERANEISTVNPAASFSSDLDHPCGTALLLSQPCYFADALEGEPHAHAHPRVINGSRQDRCRSRQNRCAGAAEKHCAHRRRFEQRRFPALRRWNQTGDHTLQPGSIAALCVGGYLSGPGMSASHRCLERRSTSRRP